MPTVLVVDDEENILYGLRKALSKRGWEVLEAMSVDEARNILKTYPVEVVLTDIRMEGESGLVLLQEIKAQNPNIRTVVMTARGSEDMEREVMALGAEAYIEKPFDLNYLDRVMKNLLTRKGFKGVVQELSLIDILQLLSYESGTAKVEVSSPEGKGALYVQDGRLVHAVFEDLQGMEAVDRILSLEGGQFSVRRGEVSDVTTMNEALDALLLKVVTSKDESSSQSVEEGVLDLSNLESFSLTAGLETEVKEVPQEVKEKAKSVAEALSKIKGAISGGVYAIDYDYVEAFGENTLEADILNRIVKVLRGLGREEMFIDGETSYYFRLKGDQIVWIESKGTPMLILRVETEKVS